MKTEEKTKFVHFARTYRSMHKENLLLAGTDLRDWGRHNLDSMDPSMGHWGSLEMMLNTEWDMASALMEILLGEALEMVLDTEYLGLVQELEQEIRLEQGSLLEQEILLAFESEQETLLVQESLSEQESLLEQEILLAFE